MDTAVSILGLSWDGQSIPGIPGYSDKGGRGSRAVSIPGLSWDGQSIPGIPGYSDKGGRGRRAVSIPGYSMCCALSRVHCIHVY